MRNVLLVGALFFSVGCGVTEAEINESGDDTAAANGELGTSVRSFVVARRDYRKCAAPMCGGWYVRDVNRTTVREEYVSAFDYSQVSDEVQYDIAGARDNEFVLYGKLGRAGAGGYRKFVISTAWRGMPGVTFGATDAFMKVQGVNIQCFAAPCPSLQATKLHSTTKTLFHDVEVKPAALPLVDRNWLTYRVTDGDAIVAGKFVDGMQVGTGVEKVLEASQVFIKLPDMSRSCGKPFVAQCPSGQTNLWARDADRCLVPAGCGGGGACAAVVPECAEGYTLVSWTGGRFACTQYACDPTFLFED